MMLPHSEQVGASVAALLNAVPAWPDPEAACPSAAEGEGATSAVPSAAPFETILVVSFIS